MGSPHARDVVIRDATQGDVPRLAAINKSVAVHRDRVRDADGRTMRYLLAEVADEVLGYGCLVLSQPPTWPEAGHLPQLIDLYVREERRGEGIGTRLVRAMEEMARQAGCEEMHVGVDPDGNPRALALYERLGYQAMDEQPREERWEFVDSDGRRHAGVEWLIYMRRSLI